MGLLVHHEYPFDGEEHPFDEERVHVPCTTSEYPGWVSVIGRSWLSAPRREFLEAEAAGGGLVEWRG